MAVTIRDATAEDARAIGEVHVASWRWAYRGQLPDEVLNDLSVDDREALWTAWFLGCEARAALLVAEEEDGVVVGFANAGRNGRPASVFRGPQAPLARDELIPAVHATDQNRLQEVMFFQALGERDNLGFAEIAPAHRLHGKRSEEGGRHVCRRKRSSIAAFQESHVSRHQIIGGDGLERVVFARNKTKLGGRQRRLKP